MTVSQTKMTKTNPTQALAVCFALVAFLFCASAGMATPTFESMPLAEVKAAPNLKILRFQILSINCAACANAMSIKMAELEGVEYVKIDMVKPVGAQAEVIFAPSKIQPEAITDLVHEFHYSEAAVKTTNWPEKQITKSKTKASKSKSAAR